jgi:hypothetical protein
MGIGTFEPASRWWAPRVEAHSHLMNGDVLVVPTQGHQVVRVVITPVGSSPDVMRLDPVAPLTAIDLASALVSMEDEAANRRGDGFPEIGDSDRSPVVTADDDPNLAGEEDLGGVLGPTLGPGDSVTPASP